MDERISEPEDPIKQAWVLSSPDSKTEEIRKPNKEEVMNIALRAVQDGICPGAIYDSTFMPALNRDNPGQSDIIAELAYSTTDMNDKHGRPVEKIIAIIKDYSGRELSRRDVGFMVREVEESEGDIISDQLLN